MLGTITEAEPHANAIWNFFCFFLDPKALKMSYVVDVKTIATKTSLIQKDHMKPKSAYKTQDIPLEAGVYVFRNNSGDVIYVGKAKSLRKRLASYFQPSRKRTADAKLRSLINSIAFFDYHVVKNEHEALLLESRLIKEYTPRYNVERRDDKRFLLLVVDHSETYPRLQLTRLKKNDGRTYFGPFPNANALRATVRFLSRRYKLRTCNVREPTAEHCKHCLDQDIKACSCPCVNQISPEDYAQKLNQVLDVLRGNIKEELESLETEMKELAQKQRFEDAALRRDMMENLKSVGKAERLRTFERSTLVPADISNTAVTSLQNALGLKHPPETIECFDISNISGTLSVGSMVCFQHGRPARKLYRRFRIKEVDGVNDFAMIAETVRRRYTRLQTEEKPFPDLVVIDGGPGQLNAAVAALAKAELPVMPVISLAKRHEEIYIPGESTPIQLSVDHPGRKLLQAIRDEAHRFAISYHRELRNKRIADSLLTEIDGVGAKRAETLLRTFGSVARIRQATPEAINQKVPGIGHNLAQQIIDYLKEHAP
jgi:excinuclease ABC subunit C